MRTHLPRFDEMTVNDIQELLDLLREARSDWIKDTRSDGDQYGCRTVPAGAAIRAFGKRIDETLERFNRG